MKSKTVQYLIDLLMGRKRLVIVNNLLYDLKNLNTIKVIGDSHCNFFSGHELICFKKINKTGINNCNDLLDKFTTFHLGPALAYNLNKYNTQTQAREKVEYLIKSQLVPNNSTIICCFGEIDIRVHVLKQAKEQNKSIESVIHNILNNYLEFLLFLKQNNSVYVWGPIPTQKDGLEENEYIKKYFPCYGTEIDRNKATMIFNQELKKICEENDIGFLSIFDKLIDENYHTKIDYIADGCHLSQKAWVYANDELAKYNLI